MNIWNKISPKNINKINLNLDPFGNDIWKKKISEKIRLNKYNIKKNYSKYFLTSSPLPLIFLTYKKNKIHIADYGSGEQEIFFQLLNFKEGNKKIYIDSIEVPEITKLLRKQIKKKIKNNIFINFLKNFNFKKKYDFVNISDCLQYDLNWKNFLIKIVKKKPKFIILNNLTAGKFKTYITEQKFYNDKLPYLFFNENEIIKIFKNYKIYKYLFLNKIKNKYQQYPQNNFSVKDRIGYPKTFIFIRKN